MTETGTPKIAFVRLPNGDVIQIDGPYTWHANGGYSRAYGLYVTDPRPEDVVRWRQEYLVPLAQWNGWTLADPPADPDPEH